jgi:hypothetical protein
MRLRAVNGSSAFKSDVFTLAVGPSLPESTIACAIQPTAPAMTKASPLAATIIGHRVKDEIGRCVGLEAIEAGGGIGMKIGGGVGVAALLELDKPSAAAFSQFGKPCRQIKLALPISPSRTKCSRCWRDTGPRVSPPCR